MVYKIKLNVNKLNADYFLKIFAYSPELRKISCACKRVSILKSGSCHLNRASNDEFNVECLF